MDHLDGKWTIYTWEMDYPLILIINHHNIAIYTEFTDFSHEELRFSIVFCMFTRGQTGALVQQHPPRLARVQADPAQWQPHGTILHVLFAAAKRAWTTRQVRDVWGQREKPYMEMVTFEATM